MKPSVFKLQFNYHCKGVSAINPDDEKKLKTFGL